MPCHAAPGRAAQPMLPLAFSARRAISCRHENPAMRTLTVTTAALALSLSGPAAAIVGGAAPSSEGIGRSVITIVGSRGNFCTGSLIAPQLVLTVAHCVQPGADYKIVHYGKDRQPELQDVKTVAIHPGFRMGEMLAHRATADVALLRLAIPANGK